MQVGQRLKVVQWVTGEEELLGEEVTTGCKVELLWKLAKYEGDYDVIRIFSERKDGKDFVVSYFRGDHLVEGRTVIRRFYGPVITGWRNDTVDVETDEYLGWQGVEEPRLNKKDENVLNLWNVELLN